MAEATRVEENLAALFPAGLRGKRIHAVGAGGSGISAALWLAREAGAHVSGCDAALTSNARLLTAQGIHIAQGHDPAHVAAPEPLDLVVVTPAVTFLHPHHPETEAARARGIPVVKWQALLGYLMRDSVGVSVAGVHGKGSTTSLLGSLAIAGGLDPTCEVGAQVIDWGRNVRLGHGAYFINEADEFDYNFLYYHPRVVVLTAVEYDHPEFFPTYEAIRDAFVTFLRGMDLSERGAGSVAPTLIINADSPGCLDVVRQLGDWLGVVRTFGITSADADVRAEDVAIANATTFTLRLRGANLGTVTLHTPGIHYVYNALAAAAAADVLGVAPEVLAPALAAFGGLRRRFEVIEDGDITYVDDYAHHPHAIALTLETARSRFPGRRLIAIFQPTLYTRLHRFLQPYSEAFDAADQVLIVETQASREVDTGLVHGNDLVQRIAARPAFAARPDAARYGGTFAETAAQVRALRQPGDVVVVMGSGPVNAVIAGARGE